MNELFLITEDIHWVSKSWLEDKIEKLNKRAKKVGCNPLKLTFGEPFIKEIDKRKVEFISATIEGETPKYKGWILTSMFERESDLIMTRTVPGKTLPKELFPNDIRCQHCGTNHFRKKSFLMQNEETKEYKEVGSSCVKDFFGEDPKAFLFSAKYFDANSFFGDEPEFVGGGRYTACYELNEFLAISNLMINNFGWTSKSKVFEQGFGQSTAEHVAEWFWLHDWRNERLLANSADGYKERPTEKDFSLAKEVVEYFSEIEVEDNEYLLNCQKVTKLGYVPDRSFGLVVSMVASYLRHLNILAQKKANEELRKKNLQSDYFGEIKKRYDLEVKYITSSNFEGQFGVTFIYSFRDETGNLFKWFTGNEFNFHPDKTIKMKGTVKKHDEYKGIKSTVLTRCAIQNS